MAQVTLVGTGLFPHEYSGSASENLTHYGLVTPYGDTELGQHWLR